MNLKFLVKDNIYYKIEAKLDIEKRLITFTPIKLNSESILEALFNNDYSILTDKTQKPQSFTVINDKNKRLHLNNAFYSFTLGLISIFKFLPFEYILEDINLNINKDGITNFKGIHMEDNSLGSLMPLKKNKFNYKNFNIEIYRKKIDDEQLKFEKYYLIINVKSFLRPYYDYIEIYQLILDLVSIIIGKTPPLKRTEISIDKLSGVIHYDLIQKYSHSKLGNLSPIENLTKDTVNEETITKYESLKKDYLTIINVIINQLNYQNYIELRLATFLQCFEGYYRNTVNQSGNALEAFEYLFSEENTSKILCYSDRKLVDIGKKNNIIKREIFIQHMYVHRNYFSHYNSKTHNKLIDHENYYAYMKVSLAVRYMLIKDINDNIDNSRLLNSIEQVNKLRDTFNIQLKYD